MAQCTICKKEHTAHLSISGMYICNECAKEEGIQPEDHRTCYRCLRTTSKFHGNQDYLGFKCNICIQEEYDETMTEFLKDPLHENVPVEDLFKENKKYRNAVIVSLLILVSSILSIAIYLLKPSQPENTHEDTHKHIESR